MVSGSFVWRSVAVTFLVAAVLGAQQPSLESVLARLDGLEQDKRRLERQIDELRKVLAELQAAKTAAEEKLDVHERRVEEVAQTKVEAAERFPVKLSGLVLMNSYFYAGRTAGAELPMAAALSPPLRTAGGTFRNTQLAFEYSGPRALGAQIAGRLELDFFGGSLNIQNHLARIRRANVGLSWATRGLLFAVDKPVFSPREPDSLSQLGISPFANSGNLWLWQPQLRYEERLSFSPSTGLRARLGVYQTNETLAAVPANVTLSRSRPALQGRLELFHAAASGRRFELAPGFHVSRSQVAGTGVDSHLVSVDWLAPVAPRLDWTGFAFVGQDLTGLGISAIRQAFAFRAGRPYAVRGRGGWTQGTVHFTNWADLNLIAGMQDDFNRDLAADGIARNLSYAANLRFRLAPNVLLGIEAMQIRTTYRQSGTRLIDRYDLALGYLF